MRAPASMTPPLVLNSISGFLILEITECAIVAFFADGLARPDSGSCGNGLRPRTVLAPPTDLGIEPLIGPLFGLWCGGCCCLLFLELALALLDEGRKSD